MQIEPAEARPGDVIEVRAVHPREPGRMGEVVERLGAEDAIHFRVRWEDGHESIFYPANGVRVLRGGSTQRGETS
jgi:hypothetical protein